MGRKAALCDDATPLGIAPGRPPAAFSDTVTLGGLSEDTVPGILHS